MQLMQQMYCMHCTDQIICAMCPAIMHECSSHPSCVCHLRGKTALGLFTFIKVFALDILHAINSCSYCQVLSSPSECSKLTSHSQHMYRTLFPCHMLLSSRCPRSTLATVRTWKQLWTRRFCADKRALGRLLCAIAYVCRRYHSSPSYSNLRSSSVTKYDPVWKLLPKRQRDKVHPTSHCLTKIKAAVCCLLA